MDVKVPDSILEKTLFCNHRYRCQSSDWQPCGCIKEYITHTLIEGECQTGKRKNCAYHMTNKNKHYCNCPTRIEIYRRYGI